MTTRRATTRVTLDFAAGGAGVRVIDDDAAEERAAYERLHAVSAAGAGAPAPRHHADVNVGGGGGGGGGGAPHPAPAGSGFFANTTLHGRAAAIYATLRDDLAADGAA